MCFVRLLVLFPSSHCRIPTYGPSKWWAPKSETKMSRSCVPYYRGRWIYYHLYLLYLPLYLSIYIYMYLSISIYIYLSLSIYWSVYLSIHTSIYQTTGMRINYKIEHKSTKNVRSRLPTTPSGLGASVRCRLRRRFEQVVDAETRGLGKLNFNDLDAKNMAHGFNK